MYYLFSTGNMGMPRVVKDEELTTLVRPAVLEKCRNGRIGTKFDGGYVAAGVNKTITKLSEEQYNAYVVLFRIRDEQYRIIADAELVIKKNEKHISRLTCQGIMPPIEALT
jgi:hypothetical protein